MKTPSRILVSWLAIFGAGILPSRRSGQGMQRLPRLFSIPCLYVLKSVNVWASKVFRLPYGIYGNNDPIDFSMFYLLLALRKQCLLELLVKFIVFCVSESLHFSRTQVKRSKPKIQTYRLPLAASEYPVIFILYTLLHSPSSFCFCFYSVICYAFLLLSCICKEYPKLIIVYLINYICLQHFRVS